MADGTVKQVSPITGTEVWTVPGRANRPIGGPATPPQPLDPAAHGAHCAFCERRYLDTPPEKSRLVRDGDGQGGGWRTLPALPAEALDETVAEFRRIPNLFEILSFDYWRKNYGYEMPDAAAARQAAYLATDAGREHVARVVTQKLRASGDPDTTWESLGDAERDELARGFFAGGHDVVVARRHFTDGAETDADLAGSGTLTPEEHARYLSFTVEAMADLYAANRYARYVAVFQNWLRPAGASFDHLHKQLVAIDERGVQAELELARLRANPNLFNEAAVNYAQYQNLVVAENDHAIAFAGFGHRYPTLEIYSRSASTKPWEHTADELRAVSDLVHACHAATGPLVPSNEEWHHQAADVDEPMPWRIVLKWRVSTLAGFEGGTKIYLNTIDPWTLRDRVVDRLFSLRDEGRVAAGIRIATEAHCRPNPLLYNPRLGNQPGGAGPDRHAPHPFVPPRCRDVSAPIGY
jgi:galactose-1-phosphate uridylyltransferase